MELDHFNLWVKELSTANVIYEIHEVEWESSPITIVRDENGKPRLTPTGNDIPSIKYKQKEDFSSFNGFNHGDDYKRHLLKLTANAIIEISSIYRDYCSEIEKKDLGFTILIEISSRLKELKILLKTNHNANVAYKNKSTVHGEKGFKPEWTNAYQFTELQRMSLRSVNETTKNLHHLYSVDYDTLDKLRVNGYAKLRWNAKLLPTGSEQFKSFHANLQSLGYISDKFEPFTKSIKNPNIEKGAIKWYKTAGELAYLIRQLKKRGYFIVPEGVGIWEASITTFIQADGFDFKSADTLHRSSAITPNQRKILDPIIASLSQGI